MRPPGEQVSQQNPKLKSLRESQELRSSQELEVEEPEKETDIKEKTTSDMEVMLSQEIPQLQEQPSK